MAQKADAAPELDAPIPGATFGEEVTSHDGLIVDELGILLKTTMIGSYVRHQTFQGSVKVLDVDSESQRIAFDFKDERDVMHVGQALGTKETTDAGMPKGRAPNLYLRQPPSVTGKVVTRFFRLSE